MQNILTVCDGLHVSVLLFNVKKVNRTNLRGQKREKAKEKWVLSTSRTGILLQRQSWHADVSVISTQPSDIRADLKRTAQGGYTRVTRHLHCSADVCSCHCVSPLPHFFFWACSCLKRLKWLPPEIAYYSPTVRSSWFLSPKARSRYKQPLW